MKKLKKLNKKGIFLASSIGITIISILTFGIKSNAFNDNEVDEYFFSYNSYENDEWLESCNTYTGETFEYKLNNEVIDNLDYDNKMFEESVLAQFVKEINSEENPEFKYWKDSTYTKPVILYDFNDQEYASMYGIVNCEKLVGYVLVGKGDETAPILEYSTNSDRFIGCLDNEKNYFSREYGIVKEENDELKSIIDETVYLKKDLEKSNEIDSILKEQIKEEWNIFRKEEKPVESYSINDNDMVSNEKNSRLSTQVITGANASSTFEAVMVDVPTSDYTYQNTCTTTAIAMYLDAIGRYVEPGVYGNYNPFSIKINDYFYNNRDKQNANTLSWQEVYDKTNDYLEKHKQTSSISFNKYIHFAGSGYTNEQIFYKFKDYLIKYNIPVMLGWWGDIMLGVGYRETSNGNFFVARDTWTWDRTPYRSYYANSTTYNYVLIGNTYSISDKNTTWIKNTLKQGMNDINVKRLRYRLKSLYYNVDNLTSSTFDANLTNVVKQFQADNGLEADGIVGKNTYYALVYAHLLKYDNDVKYYRILSNGKKGDDVAQLQMRLTRLKYYNASCDGIYGSGTANAVKDFQRAHNLDVDGKVGPKTMEVMAYETLKSK